MKNTFIKDKVKAAQIKEEIEIKAEALKKEILESESDYGEAFGNIYYVSECGDDGNDGLSPENPIRTLIKVSELDLQPGDAVLFKRGETFRGILRCKQGVVYSAYGKGSKPVLTSSLQNYASEELWVETNVKNVYKLTIPIMNDAGLIVFDEGKAWSFKRIKGNPDFPEGGLENLDCDFAMWHDVSRPVGVEGYVYLRCDKGNPGKLFSSIEVGTSRCIAYGSCDVTFDNLCFKYGGAHGIGAGTVNGLCVRYCEFGWIGGSWHNFERRSRFGNAIEIYGGCRNYVCDHNYIYQIYDAGITHQYKSDKGDILMCDIRYSDNLIEDTTYSIEYFLAFSDKSKLEEGDDPGIRYMKNVEMCGNIMRRSGCGFGDQRPNKDQAAHIKSWNHDNPAMNFTIHDNIMDTAKYMLMHIGVSNHKWMPTLYGNLYVTGDGNEATCGIFGDYSVNAADKVCKHIRYDADFEKNAEELICENNSIFVIEK